jgi:hypothetical protein
MKSLLFVCALAITSSAHALTVGDSATYTYTGAGQTHEMAQTVSAISGDNYTLHTTIDGAAQADASGSITALASLTQVSASCAQYGGDIQSVTTPAGTFNACHMNQQGEDIYLSADVTFGIVKVDGTDNGTAYDVSLKAFVKH